MLAKLIREHKLVPVVPSTASSKTQGFLLLLLMLEDLHDRGRNCDEP